MATKMGIRTMGAPEGLQVWCRRHECNVVALEFGEQDVRYAPEDEDRAAPTRVAK